MGLREQGTPDGIRFSISLIIEKEQTTNKRIESRGNNMKVTYYGIRIEVL